MIRSLNNIVMTVQENFSFATTYFDRVKADFQIAAGDEDSGDNGGFNPMSAGTGVLPAPSTWLKADGANNSILKSMKRIAKATQAKNLRSVHIS